jgi:hypothetical protein
MIGIRTHEPMYNGFVRENLIRENYYTFEHPKSDHWVSGYDSSAGPSKPRTSIHILTRKLIVSRHPSVYDLTRIQCKLPSVRV